MKVGKNLIYFLSKSHIANFGILKEIQNCIHFCYRESTQNKGANYAGSE